MKNSHVFLVLILSVITIALAMQPNEMREGKEWIVWSIIGGAWLILEIKMFKRK